MHELSLDLAVRLVGLGAEGAAEERVPKDTPLRLREANDILVVADKVAVVPDLELAPLASLAVEGKPF